MGVRTPNLTKTVHETDYRKQLVIGPLGQKRVNQNYDKSLIHLPRQEVVFLESVRKIKGCGSLREYFYTKFKPKN